ncbi:MAG TPA: glucose-6-phosphate dehydrogenase assembly protein OpcA, partial [Candidatus Methylomirabilis sp.]|nr:glucose-6-phosphate dehydrogenase assembly protein OpcA [Candidatus Methylomirabilis sp.]
MAAPLAEGAGARPQSRLVPGAPSPVPVRAVEGELARLREEATQVPDASSGPGALRACTLNLVVAARGGEGPADLAPLIAEIMAEHPCRALLLVEDPAAGASPLAAVTAVCHRPAAGGGLVCGEQVLLAAGAEGRRAVAGAALSLLVPDLPVALWWRAGPLEADERFARLAGLADRILLDSASLGDGRPDFPALTGLVERYRETALTDLQWARLTSWRSLTAQFFDPPEMRPCLTRLAE